MGTFSVTIKVFGPDDQQSEELPALVDTGATTTVVPRSVLTRLGITPMDRQTFSYANGQRVDLDLAEVRVRVDGRQTTTWVIFGEDENGEALLGAYTLQGTFLGVDTRNEGLIPVEGLLKQLQTRQWRCL